MRSTALVSAAIVLALLAGCASAQDYMGLVWNQSVKEVMSGLDVGDVNGDGRVEVAVSGTSDGLVYLFDPTGTLLWKRDVASYVNTVRVADINRDGKAEVIVGHKDLYVFNGSGDRIGRFTSTTGVYGIRTGDLTGDGGAEIVFSSYSNSECKGSALTAIDCSGATNNMSGCRQMWSYDLDDYQPFDFTIADYNGDGKKEIAVALVYRHTGSSKMNGCEKLFAKPGKVILLNGQGKPMWDYNTQNGVVAIAAGDVNGDGKSDVVAGGYPDINVFSGDGRLLWSDTTHIASYVEDIAAADLYKDNRSEVIAAANGVYVFGEGGTLNFTAQTDSRAYSVLAADVDKDGFPEIIAGSSSLYVFDNKGSLRWKGPAHTNYGYLRAADLDKTGYNEIVAGSVKNVYAFKTLTYAKNVRADELYKQAMILAPSNVPLALDKLKEAKGLYFELNQVGRVADCINQIDRLSDSTGRTSALRAQADSELNQSRQLMDAGDYINSDRAALKARGDYSSLGDVSKVDESKVLDDQLKQIIAVNATQEFLAANESYYARDYNASLAHALKAEEYYDFLGDMDRKEKAGLYATNLRNILGIREGNQTSAPENIQSDFSKAVDKVKSNTLLIIAAACAVIVVALLVVLSLYFWRLSRRKTLKLDSLPRRSYMREESRPAERPAEDPMKRRRNHTVEQYRSSEEPKKPLFLKEEARPVERPAEDPIKRRRSHTVEQYKTADEPQKAMFPPQEAQPQTLRTRRMPTVAKYQTAGTEPQMERRTFEPQQPRQLLERRPRQADAFTTKSSSGPVSLSANKGIFKSKACRHGLCMKARVIKGSRRL